MKVYLIGAGPGDPELITLKARRILGDCDAVVYDDLIPTEILSFARSDAEQIYVGKRGGKKYKSQEEINQLLVDLAKKGHSVARIKGGDPCIFGRGGEEALYLHQHGIEFEFIPGITSAIAGPISVGIPPTHRSLSSSLKFVTAHEDPGKQSGFVDYSLLARDTGTLVFLMGARRIAAIAERLMQEGMAADTPCCLIQNATAPLEKHVVSTLNNVARDAQAQEIGSPCVMVVGKVVELSRTLNRKKVLPLSGISALITRPAHLAWSTSQLFSSQGALSVIYPLVEIAPLDFELPDIKAYDMYIFTSQNAVSLFFERLFCENRDAREFAGTSIYCIGPKTLSALKNYGIIADGMAREFRAEGIVALLKTEDLKGKRICLPRARGARKYLAEALQARGSQVDEIYVYETILPKKANKADFLQALSKVNTVIFTSPSGVRHACELLGDDTGLLKEKLLAAIGPVTAQALQASGFEPQICAQEYTDTGIIQALQGASS